jgi:nucleoside-diphosphate-sugar epimerase
LNQNLLQYHFLNFYACPVKCEANLYGNSAVIPKFIKMMSNNQQPTIYGDGTQSRDFIPQSGFRINSTYVVPMQIGIVEANILSATKEVTFGLVMNGVYPANAVACHGQITLNALVQELNGLLNKKIEPIYAKPRHGDIKHSFADINLLEKKLGFTPSVEFKEGLKRTVSYFERIQ